MNDDLFNLIDRMANLLRQETRFEGQSLGLQPIQQEALYYLSSCNKYSDTTLAVTQYLGLTKGTVSQTLKVLESKALIERQQDPTDKRIIHLKLTPSGNAFLAKTAPPQKFSDAMSELSSEEQVMAAALLKKMLFSYQMSTGRTAFGVCKNCQFNQQTSDGFYCNLTKEALSVYDTSLICKEFARE